MTRFSNWSRKNSFFSQRETL